MNILVLNCGSSSLKYQLLDMDREVPLVRGLAERIGMEGARLTLQSPGAAPLELMQSITTHREAVQLMLKAIADPDLGGITARGAIEAVGHRVVHGGECYTGSVIINSQVMERLECLSDLAPLHNPPNLVGIKACMEMMPGILQVAVFDTAFHQTIPAYAYLYGIPYELYQRYGIRRYGFHGTSHRFVVQRAGLILGRRPDELKIITCHLGNGASVTAVNNGRSIDTSMGFTPLEGLTMGTRSGDLDPSVVLFLMEKEGLSVREIRDLLNKQSGVLGISGLSSDLRDLEQAAAEGHQRAELALEIFAYDVKKYIGAYAAVLNGVDALVFTAGIGENSPGMRARICRQLDYLGMELDEGKNQECGRELDIAASGAKVRVLVIPTNEELMIARDTQELLTNISPVT
ncbi:MAG: acetate/propionate family kinase [Bacillota bacterium]